MSQTPVHLRPKAKRTFHWEDTKVPAKPAGHRKRERTHEHRAHPHLRQIALALAFCLLTGCYAMMPPESAATSVLAAKKELPVYSVERDDHVIAVTFDASWGADNTPKLLDILDEYDAKCTFFLVGLWVDKYPDMVQAIVERGHEIGNHGYTHERFVEKSREEQIEIIESFLDGLKK